MTVMGQMTKLTVLKQMSSIKYRS